MHKQAIEMFLDMMAAEKGAANNTIAAYRQDLTQFLQFNNICANQICSEHISKYIQQLGAEFKSSRTQARKLSAIREFCRFLYSEKILAENPSLNISSPKQEKNLPKFLTARQIELLVKKAGTHNNLQFKRAGLIIGLMFATGLRVSEAVSLPENAINHDKKEVIVRGKGSKERIIPVSDETLKQLSDYANYRNYFIADGKKSAWLFPSKRGNNNHISRSGFFRLLKELALECDLNPELISPHTLRHSFATNLVNHDADLRSVQKMLGHESVATTEIYTHITSERLLKAVSKKHPLNRYFSENTKK